jgi:penicillin-binding protein 2
MAVTPGGGTRRQYPQGTLAGPLTGYVDGDSAGRAGLEAEMDDLLAGKRGGRLTVLAPSGEIASTLSSVPAQPGETVRLTLDLDLQRECEAALGERAGSVVVLNARDGAVLALASYPQYDPNVFVAGGDVGAILGDPRQPLVNRPLVGLYPPGSIFKAVTMAAGLERGVVRPDSEFVCTGRWTGIAGLTFDCWLRSGHGRLNLVSGLTQSCNCVFYEVGKLLDEQDANALPEVAVRSGFGGATGAVPGQEPGGTVPGPQWKRQTLNDGWARGDAVNMAIGQGQLLVTPLQVAALYAAIAAGGQRLGPRLLDRAQLPGGNVERLLPPAAKPPLPWSAATLEAVRSGLRGVVGAGNGTAAAVFQGSPLAGITAGKTGTAESGGGRAPHAWFACFAPVDAPQVVVLAMLEHAGEGSQVAAPLARGVLETALGGYARYTGST